MSELTESDVTRGETHPNQTHFVQENDSDDEEDKQGDWDEEEPEYKLEMAHGYAKKGQKPK